MAKVLKIVGISGSLRAASTHSGLIRSAQKSFAGIADVEFSVADIRDLPIYDGDLEKTVDEHTVFPEAVERFRKVIREADALFIAVPEYNYSIAAPLKNAIDWASRPPNSFDDKPTAILGAGSGGGRALYHFRQVAVYLNLHILNRPEVIIRSWEAPQKFDWSSGDLVDDASAQKVDELAKSLVTWARRLIH